MITRLSRDNNEVMAQSKRAGSRNRVKLVPYHSIAETDVAGESWRIKSGALFRTECTTCRAGHVSDVTCCIQISCMPL